MQVLAVASAKGGVGKTTVSLNLALALAELGTRVVLVDTDPQGAVGLWLGGRLSERPGIADCLAGEADPSQCVVATRIVGLSLLPVGRIAPQETDAFSAAMLDGRRFRALLGELRARTDLVLVDTPCGFGGITMGVLRSATHLLAPIQAEAIALRSVPQLLGLLRDLRRDGASIELLGFVLTMLATELEASREVERDVREIAGPSLMLEPPLRRDPVFAEATAAGVPLKLLGPRSERATAAFEQLALGVRRRLVPKDASASGPFLEEM